MDVKVRTIIFFIEITSQFKAIVPKKDVNKR